MGKVRSRDARKLQKSLKSHNLTKPQHHKAWEILKRDGIDAALRFVAETDNPPIINDEPVPYQIWGREQVDKQSINQMNNAARLPIAVQGALMPDAHLGYGLPIGGVLATDNAVIPYAVGVDIACRMRITIYDVTVDVLKSEHDLLVDSLMQETRFGAGASFSSRDLSEHAVMDDPLWQEDTLLRGLYDKSIEQLGTSGGGNHFVEWGIFELDAPDEALGINRAGRYLALLSHSGSRGMGYALANYYSRLARDLHPNLPDDVKHLAWLDMDSEEGGAYWEAMSLAGRYASANHACIHERITNMTTLPILATVENHHNFAWKEELDGREVIVHRKGATPAGVGVMGIIPGSMGDPGYVVRGKGKEASINSASHGAGRKMSRRQAKKTISKAAQMGYLKERGIELLGGGLDEAPHAYKDIHEVIEAQADLIEVVGEFQPKIVRMAND
ncbi:MAG: RtcB family protein [Chloroflexota bacterium]